MSYKPQVLVVAEGGTGRITLTNHGILVGAATTAITQLAAGTAGQVLQSGGASADPAYSTSTFPSTATSTGTILRADGTNWVATTATYPATTTANQLLYSSATNVVGGLTSANNSVVLTDGSGVPSLATSLSNDFTFTKSTAGATTTLTVSETSNTASASAAIIANVAGGTAADAVYKSTITAGQAWTWGLDNSDSDAYVLASSATLGTTNVMRVATTGEITFPLQSAFLAYNSGTVTDVTGDATVYTLICDTEVYDQNSDYDNSTGTFTAPLAGRYRFDSTITLTDVGAGHTTAIAQFVVNGSLTARGNSNSPAAIRTAGNVVSYNQSCIFSLAANDTVVVQIQVSGSTKTVDVNGSSNYNTFFAGTLIC